jgi:hypothetical protein
MFINSISSITIGWTAISAGIAGLIGFVLIILFFTVGQPFGTLNDIFIGLTAILSVVVICMLYPGFQARSALPIQVLLVLSILGAILVLTGMGLSISGAKGWFLSGLYMAAGNGMIGLWMLGINYFALQDNSLPHGLAIFGLISAVILALGLVTIPGILRGIDTKEYKLTLFNSIWWASSLGYLALYPTWCILLGRTLLLK